MNDTDIAYLYANGVVDNVNGMIEVLVLLYRNRLIIALRSDANGQTQG